jgi:flagellar secretion chaperone FliS
MPAAPVSAYTKTDIETASQGKLIVMLFDGAIKRANEAKRQLEAGSIKGVHDNLIRAQDIITELRSAINMKAGEFAGELDRLYEYFLHLLVTANIRKKAEPIDECVALMEDIRDAWQELFDQLGKEAKPGAKAPKINPHGSSMLNMRG